MSAPANPEMEPSLAQVRDRAVRPSGLLPKHAQTFVIVGVAAVMIAAIAFSSGRTPVKPARGPNPPAAVVDPNLARIEEYRARIDQQARKLAAEQARLEQTKQALGFSPGLENPAASPAPPAAADRASPQGTALEQERQALEAEKRKRDYQSLFASNLALSYRKEPQAKPAAASPPTLSSMPGTPAFNPWPHPLEQNWQAGPAPSKRALPPARPSPDPAIRSPEDSRQEDLETESPTIDPSLQKAEGRPYRLFEGTIIETVLTNRLDSTFNGPVNAMVTSDVFSRDLQHLLIPKGSRILGEARRNTTYGQERLAVFFHRIIMPDGYSASLDQFQGLSQIGQIGLRDQANHHYTEVFGASLAIGAIAGLANANTSYGLNASSADIYRQGAAASLAQSSLHILDRFLNLLPTFTIREGHRIKVVLSDDLLLPAYDRHRLPPEL